MAEYIDRDKIISAIIRWEDKPYFSYYAVLRDVMNLPSSDVVERKHGKWIIVDKYSDYRTERCSACGFVANRTYIQDIWSFCPNCGARMDGDMLSEKGKSTNADIIRGMNDNQLAQFLNEVRSAEGYLTKPWIEWLRKETE